MSFLKALVSPGGQPEVDALATSPSHDPCLLGGRCFQGREIGDDGVQLIGGEFQGRHLALRHLRLRVLDIGLQPRLVVLGADAVERSIEIFLDFPRGIIDIYTSVAAETGG